MKIYCNILFILILISCNKEYKSPNGYNQIKIYEYKGKPLDDDVMNNDLYNDFRSDKVLFNKIEKLNYNFKRSFKTNSRIDSLLFNGNYLKYRPRPRCPIGFNRILILYEYSKLKYIVKFNYYCKECFLINPTTNEVYYLKIGYEDFSKFLK